MSDFQPEGEVEPWPGWLMTVTLPLSWSMMP